MEYQVSARKWRPQTFEEVVGQGHIARTLTNAIHQGRIAHAYLFSGMRGVGKTTMARILAKTLNCKAVAENPAAVACQTCPSCETITAGQSVDVVEIDGASNRGIDEIRELKEMIRYAPMAGKYKIYIIDEVHMLTKEAFNALLKTLEEPPSHVVFIFATTEDHKIPSTILSRCQHFHFKRITRQAITQQLERIIRKEGVRLSSQGLSMIAKSADGSLRDALSLLDQSVAYSGQEVKDEDLRVILGTAGRAYLLAVIQAILDRDAPAALGQLKALADQGVDYRQFTTELIEYFRHLVIAGSTAHPEELIDLPSEEVSEICDLSLRAGVEEFQRLFGIFAVALESLRGAVHPGFILEIAVIQAIRIKPLESFEKLLERLDVLENSFGGGIPDSGLANSPSASEKRPSGSSPGTAPGVSSGPIESPSTEPLPHPGPSVRPTPEGTPSRETRGAKAFPDHRLLAEQWSVVVRRILQKKPNLGSYLEKAVVQEFVPGQGKEKSVLVIGFEDESAFLIDLVQKEENVLATVSVLQDVFQRSVRIKMVRLERSEEEKRQEQLKKDQEQERHRKRKKQEALSHPLVKEALTILGGEVIDNNES